MNAQELTPEYVLQPHVISRAIYRLSATARKLIAMGMSVLPPDLSNITASFTYHEFCQALGLDRSGKYYALIQAAISECVRSEITIDTEEKWQTFTWIQTAEINKKTNCISITFSSGLAAYLLTLKKMYARINLVDFGNLQSLYAIRLFELAKSYESLAGQQGNKPNQWFFERTIEGLREIMGVEAEKYTKTNDFKRFVIEAPLAELNASNLGFKITPEYVRKGKYLVAVRFLCQKEGRKLQSRKQKDAPALPAPEKFPLNDHSLEEKEWEHIKKMYPDEYMELYTALLPNPPTALLRDTPRLWAREADRLTCQELLKRHGIRK